MIVELPFDVYAGVGAKRMSNVDAQQEMGTMQNWETKLYISYGILVTRHKSGATKQCEHGLLQKVMNRLWKQEEGYR